MYYSTALASRCQNYALSPSRLRSRLKRKTLSSKSVLTTLRIGCGKTSGAAQRPNRQYTTSSACGPILPPCYPLLPMGRSSFCCGIAVTGWVKFCSELPAGTFNSKEAPLAVAQRELAEEQGTWARNGRRSPPSTTTPLSKTTAFIY